MNNKGFTLAEVMGVIILLGILALITVPAVEQYVNNSREKSYNSTIEELETAAKNWNMKYGSAVTWIDLATSDVRYYALWLSELKKSEFLADEEIIDPRTNEKMTGCIYVSLIDGESYSYRYDEGCESY